VAGSTLDDTDIAVAVGARTEGLASRETIGRRFFAMTAKNPARPHFARSCNHNKLK
jgi:hypothetical protein